MCPFHIACNLPSLNDASMKNTILSLCVAMAFCGCSTTQQATTRLTADYVGKSLDSFVLDHGIPHSKYQLDDGGFVYVWSSGVIVVQMPTTTTVSGTVSPYGTYSSHATTSGGGQIEVFCEIQIQTDPNNIIRSLKPIKDTIGNWELSRCAEIFD